jgi:hypothetical protein
MGDSQNDPLRFDFDRQLKRVPRGEVGSDGPSALKVRAVRPWCAAEADFRSCAKEWHQVRWAQAERARLAAVLSWGK